MLVGDGEWQNDFLFTEQSEDFHEQIALQHISTVDHGCRRNAQADVDAVVAEPVNQYCGRGIFQNMLAAFCNIQRHGAHGIQIAIIRNSNRNCEPYGAVVRRPVCYSAVDEFGVRHDDYFVVERPHPRAACADLDYFSMCVAYINEIAELDRSFPQITIPATKLATLFCNPNPMPTPSAPPTTRRLLKFKPVVSRPITKPSAKMT